MALILVAISVFDEATPFPSLYALVPTVGAALLILFADPKTVVGRVLASRPLVGIGLISYSAYLWHQPIFAFARYRSAEEPGDVTMLLLSASAFLLAWTTWRFVELPFRRKDLISRKTLIAAAVGTGTVLLSFCFIGYAGNGFNDIRLSPGQKEIMKTVAISPRRDHCHQREPEKPEEACAYFSAQPTWAVVGNSHAVELANQLAENLRDTGDGIKHLTITACSPTYGRGESAKTSCGRWTEDVMDYLLGEERLATIVVSYRTNSLAPADESDRETAVTEAARAEAADSYFAMVHRLADAGKKVVLVLQAPDLERHIEYYVGTVGGDDRADFVAGIDRKDWDRRIAPIRQRLSELPRNVVVVDPAELFCNPSSCAAIKDGKALYYDDDHMSLAGADLVAKEILRRVRPILA